MENYHNFYFEMPPLLLYWYQYTVKNKGVYWLFALNNTQKTVRYNDLVTSAWRKDKLSTFSISVRNFLSHDFFQVK